MAVTANHHFVPQFYLRNFSTGVERKARLFAFDRKQRKSFHPHVRNVGAKRYFNRIEVAGVDPNALEERLAVLENEASAHIREIIDAKSFLSEDHFGSATYLMANLSMRVPKMRDHLNGFQGRILRAALDIGRAHGADLQVAARQLREQGLPIREDITKEALDAFMETGALDGVICQTNVIELELDAVRTIAAHLIARNWCFIEASAETHFVTSDHPCVLTWKPGEAPGGYQNSPGHGLGGTMVFFPLSSEISVIGTFEAQPQRRVYNAFQMATANSLMLRQSNAQIYARSGSFPIAVPGRGAISGVDLAQYL